LNRINLLLIIFIVTAFSGKNYAATKKESIAVFDFKLTNISPDTGNIVRNRIEYTLFKTRKFNLLERNRIDIIRKEKLIGGERRK
jgi:curli biogenesis system outer membrane secretion channel CsgG